MMFTDTYRFNDVIHRCFRCGYCKFPTNWMDVNNCPPYARFRMEPYSCGGRLWLTRAWLNEELDWSEHLAEILDIDFAGAGLDGLFVQRGEFLALADVAGHRDDLVIVVFLQPRNDDGCVQAARIGENDLFLCHDALSNLC